MKQNVGKNNYERIGFKMLIVTSALLFIMAVIISSYLFNAEVQSRPPQYIKEQCNITKESYKGRNVFKITSKNGVRSDKIIFYLHGGSYMAEMVNQHWELFRDIVNDTGCTIIAPDYPLAPKHNYVDVFNMIIPLYKEMTKTVSSDKIVFLGDSAGGGMAIALAERLAEEGQNLPSQTIAISPWLDVRMENPEIDKVQKHDPFLLKSALKIAGIAYAGKDGMGDYLVNPIDGPLEKLQNVTIFTGTYDILNPDVHVFAQKAKEKGVAIQVKETPKATHIWILNRYTREKTYHAKEDYQELIHQINQT